MVVISLYIINFIYNRLFAAITINMVSVTSASQYYSRYQSSSSMYIRGLIPGNFAELAEAVPFDIESHSSRLSNYVMHFQIAIPS